MEALTPVILLSLIAFLGAPGLILILLLLSTCILFLALGLPLNLGNFLLSLIIAGSLPLSAYLGGALLDSYAFKKNSYFSFFTFLFACFWYLSSGLYLSLFESLLVLTADSTFLNISGYILKTFNAIFQTAALSALVIMLVCWLIELPLLICNSGLNAKVDFNFTAFRQISVIFILFFTAVYLQDYFMRIFTSIYV